MVLADGLIEMGHDARIVLGRNRNEGQAWVVLFMGEKEYLLEATSKRKLRSLSGLDLAFTTRGYHPEFQFDRERFWVNTGSKLTRKHKGEHWKLQSRFQKSAGKEELIC